MAQELTSNKSSDSSGLSMAAIVTIGLIATAVLVFLMYYGWLHTPDKPWDQMR